MLYWLGYYIFRSLKCYIDLDITFFKSLDVSSHSTSKSHCAKINSNTCSSTILPFSRTYIVDKVSDAERKARVDAIHRLKERLKELSDTQKSLKLSLQDVTERLRSEREEASSSALATRGSLTMSWMIEVLDVIDWCKYHPLLGTYVKWQLWMWFVHWLVCANLR